jgi:putative acetyltransferase
VGLAPLAVRPASQKQGIGSRLVQAGLAECAALGYELAVVLGDPSYYARFGFRTASQFGLLNTYGVDEPFMALALRPGVLGRFQGLVRYAPEFEQGGN